MAEQLGFGFIADQKLQEKHARFQSRIESHVNSWRTCWNWPGPQVGGFCEVHEITAPLALSNSPHESIYCYMERCQLLHQIDEHLWLARIDMGLVHGKPWHKDGTLLYLETTNIWPPVRDMRKERNE